MQSHLHVCSSSIETPTLFTYWQGVTGEMGMMGEKGVIGITGTEGLKVRVCYHSYAMYMYIIIYMVRYLYLILIGTNFSF